VALLEAKLERATEIGKFRTEYARRNRPWFVEQAVQRKAEQAGVVVDPVQ